MPQPSFAGLLILPQRPGMFGSIRSMRTITQEEVKIRFEARARRGHRIDPRLQAEIKKPGGMFILTIQDVNAFLSLIWHARDGSRLLTPRNNPRTLGHVAQRMIDGDYDFERLSSPLGLDAGTHSPEWFTPCSEINKDFDYNQFDLIAVTPATEGEMKESPDGSFYIFDGAHKTLVLAYRLLAGIATFEPVEALLLTPRRN